MTLGVVLSSTLPEAAFNAWGWRIPFLISLPLGLVGLYLRLRLEDTPHFKAIQEDREVKSAPLRETLRTHGGDILKVVGAIVFGTALTYLLIFLPTYLTEVIGLSQTRALAANLVGVAALLVLCPIAALLSERVGRKPFLVGPALGAAVLAIPIFLSLQGSYGAVLVAHVCGRPDRALRRRLPGGLLGAVPDEGALQLALFGLQRQRLHLRGVRALDLHTSSSAPATPPPPPSTSWAPASSPSSPP